MQKAARAHSTLNEVPEASRRIGVAPMTLRRYARERLIEHVRVGHKILVTDEAIEKFLQARTVRAIEGKSK